MRSARPSATPTARCNGGAWIGGCMSAEDTAQGLGRSCSERLSLARAGTLKRQAQTASAFPRGSRRSSLSFAASRRSRQSRGSTLAGMATRRAEQFGLVPRLDSRSEVIAAEALLVQRQDVTSETCGVNDLSRLIVAGKRFGTIYADPPLGPTATRPRGPRPASIKSATTRTAISPIGAWSWMSVHAALAARS